MRAQPEQYLVMRQIRPRREEENLSCFFLPLMFAPHAAEIRQARKENWENWPDFKTDDVKMKEIFFHVTYVNVNRVACCTVCLIYV